MKTLAAFAILSTLILTKSFGVTFIFDYSYDDYNFFTPERRQVVEMAAQDFSNLAIDRGGIIPSGTNTWTWGIRNPSESSEFNYITNPSIGAGEIRVYLGAEPKESSILGKGGGIAYSFSGNSSWANLIMNTNTSSAYKPFAGVISMNLDAQWYSGIEETVPYGFFDLYSVVAHELGHVLGFGIFGHINAWDSNVNTVNHTFTGSSTTAAYGGPLPLENDNAHVLSGTQFASQTMIMTPYLPAGTRRHWTAPELRTFLDMGYLEVPEPHSLALLLLGTSLLLISRRRSQIETGN